MDEQDSCVQLAALAAEIFTNGYSYVLVERTDYKAMYGQCHKSMPGVPFAFEIFYIKKAFRKPNPRASAKERRWMEVYPSTSDWGQSAWTYTNKARALKYYRGLERRDKK